MFRSRPLGMLALLGLFTYSCVSPAGTEADDAARKRAATPKPEATATPAPTGTATPAPGAATPTPTPTPTGEAAFGEVLNADGSPARGATVKVYLSLGVGPVKSVTTDAEGRFDLAGLQSWPVNLEAVGAASGKAYVAKVLEAARGMQITLAPTGTVTGHVTAPGVAPAPDFSEVRVWIPGSSYGVNAAADGSYKLEHLPAGKFGLAAEGPVMGAATAVEVDVASGGTAAASALALAPTPPVVAALTPANGGPGRRITIAGTGFGATEGHPFTVTFQGFPAGAPQRLSDTAIEADVPASAANGDVVVRLGGAIASAGKPFRVLKRLAIAPATTALLVGNEQTFTVEARDTAEAVVSTPSLSAWRSSNPTVAEVDAAGKVTAKAAGSTILSIGSGTLEATRAITVSEPL